MARPSKLSPSQWADIERRMAEGETASKLAREFGVDESAIRRRVSPLTPKVRSVAVRLAEVQNDLAMLPPRQQYTALSLAEKLRNISSSLASAAEHGAATAHRLSALANSEVSKIDDAAVLDEKSLDAIKGVAVLTKLANESATIPLNLLAANKAQIERLNAPEEENDPDDDARAEAIARRLEASEPEATSG